MSLRNYIAISFSGDLAGRTEKEKLDALLNLKSYIEARPDIWTGYDDDDDLAPFSDPVSMRVGLLN